MPPLLTTSPHRLEKNPARRRMVITIMNRTVPMVLNTIWTTPVRLASLEEPMEQTIAVVTQVPRLIPMMMGYTNSKVITPVTDSACRIPTMAEELWMITVSTRPVTIPSIGRSLKYPIAFTKVSDSASGSTAAVIDIRPVNSTPKPRQIVPTFLDPPRLMNITRIMPRISAIGASVSGLKNVRMELPELSISISRIICAVAVVPMLAPMTILTA